MIRSTAGTSRQPLRDRWSRRLPPFAGAALATAAAAVTAFVVPVAGAEPETRAAAMAWETVIDGTSFNDRDALQREWNFLYPWGSDHNGTARMYGSATDNNHVYLSPAGTLNLKASRISWDEGTSTADPHLPIRYHSGAVHAKEKVLVNDQYPNWEVKGEFQAPTGPGTWPAFWLTGADSWPPESDILEFKGDTTNWFNTFRTSSDVSTTKVGVASASSSWHEYRAWITKVSASDVEIHYYIDGAWQASHRANFVNKPLWIIINLQMEGSSGGNGPTSDTFYRARNVYVGRSTA